METASDEKAEHSHQEEEHYFVWNSTGPENSTDKGSEWDSKTKNESQSDDQGDEPSQEGIEKESRYDWD